MKPNNSTKNFPFSSSVREETLNRILEDFGFKSEFVFNIFLKGNNLLY